MEGSRIWPWPRCARVPAARYVALGILLLLAPAATGAQQSTGTSVPPNTGRPLVLTGVTVVDVRDGQLLPNQTVVIVGTRIQAVGSSREVQRPKNAQVVNARGKYLIPGLWDMHVHVRNYTQIFYPLAIAFGVTGLRLAWEPEDAIDSLPVWRRDIAAGKRVGPRLIGTGGGLVGYDMTGGGGEIVTETPEGGRHAVDSLKTAGADFIKIHDNVLPREFFFAIANEARRIGIPLIGHLPIEVGMVEASDSGLRSIEHLHQLKQHRDLQVCWQSDSISERECSAIAARLVRNETWIVPTMTVLYYANVSVPAESLRYWPASLGGGSGGLTDMPREQFDSVVAEWREVGRRLHRAGIPMLAGTDAAPMVPMITPGLSLHEELAYLVQDGFTPLEALQTATLNPAQFFRATDSLGIVAPDKLADLVLLDANPLADIHNTMKIRAVVMDGRYFDRAALDGLRAEVEQAAGKHLPPLPPLR